jgi:predicted RNA-binding Zn-ribbon protein involved in translation (DUF1610 family)
MTAFREGVQRSTGRGAGEPAAWGAEVDRAVDLVCPACGPRRIDAADVEVHVNRCEDFALYAFSCPTCSELVVGGCRETIDLLLAAGAVRRELISTSLRPLTVDDLLDLHLWLESDPPLIP